MAEQIEDQAEMAPKPPSQSRRLVRWFMAGFAILLALAAGFAWFSRERLAEDFITTQLEKLGLEARYEIESIGPRRQVLANIVIGDPSMPDLTIERVVVTLEPRFPLVGIAGVELVRPRLYGTYRQGQLSFGALDKLLFEQESSEPFSLPDMKLSIDDGRGLLESDYGPAGFKVQGSGNLRSGFEGILAATAPDLNNEGCQAKGVTLFGKVTISNARPGFSGPLRMANLNCPQQAIALGASALEISALTDPDLKGIEGDVVLAANDLAAESHKLATLGGKGKFTWRRQALTAQYELEAGQADTTQFALDTLRIEGTARSREGFARLELQADVSAEGLKPGKGLDSVLESAATASSGTLLGPMMAQIRSALVREGRNSSLLAGLTFRKTGEMMSLIVPQARLTGSSGDTVLALSRFQMTSSSAGGTPRFSGNLTTGGAGLPRISGRMENRGGSSDMVLRLRMAEYRAGGGSLELPELVVAQEAGGALGFSGTAKASGDIPGGNAQGLVLPIRGSWSSVNGVSLWPGCAAITFDKLVLANLALEGRRLELCSPRGGAILRSDSRGTRIAAGTPALDLTGSLGETPIRLKSGAVGLAWPGMLTARDVDVELGESEEPARFRLSEIDARIDTGASGRFTGAEASLFAVPLDLSEAAGEWRFADGVLSLSEGAFLLTDRQQPGRFEPLVARNASLVMADSRIVANALLREPKSNREVLTANIVHDLSSSTGHADLNVSGLVFDKEMQPDTLTTMALGVVANVHGTVKGQGRIDWNANGVTSRGVFGTEGLDFAAAFGPVTGLGGTIEFTDLLSFVTAPDQGITIQSFNPGIEVDTGELNFEIRPDYVLAINGGRWPFIGGTLILEPALTQITEAEVRRYTLRLEGVDAAQFVERMGLANLSASGKFDGVVPLVFDESGGRIEKGHLLSRAPGGNVSYVGGLTYEDMSPIANYAFDALKSLDYSTMEIQLDGSLTGEIVTRVKFDGIRQGATASQNMVTKQLARLPIQFNVNIHAPFYRLLGTFKSMYDPAFVRDPQQLGLIDENGDPIEDPVLTPPLPGLRPEDLPEDESVIQPPESENMQ